MALTNLSFQINLSLKFPNSDCCIITILLILCRGLDICSCSSFIWPIPHKEKMLSFAETTLILKHCKTTTLNDHGQLTQITQTMYSTNWGGGKISILDHPKFLSAKDRMYCF